MQCAAAWKLCICNVPACTGHERSRTLIIKHLPSIHEVFAATFFLCLRHPNNGLSICRITIINNATVPQRVGQNGEHKLVATIILLSYSHHPISQLKLTGLLLWAHKCAHILLCNTHMLRPMRDFYRIQRLLALNEAEDFSSKNSV